MGHDSRLYQDQMSSSHGFQLIGYLLTNAGGPPHDCTGVTVHRLEKLAATVSNSEQLYCQFFLHVYANFEIWIHCDPAVQKELIEALLEHVRKRPQVGLFSLNRVDCPACIAVDSLGRIIVFPRSGWSTASTRHHS